MTSAVTFEGTGIVTERRTQSERRSTLQPLAFAPFLPAAFLAPVFAALFALFLPALFFLAAVLLAAADFFAGDLAALAALADLPTDFPAAFAGDFLAAPFFVVAAAFFFVAAAFLARPSTAVPLFAAPPFFAA